MDKSRIVLKTIGYASPEYELEVDLRSRVLREPLGLRFTEGDLALDAGDLHFGAFLGEELVGCLILHPVSKGAAKMRQVAVEPRLWGTGVGRQLVIHAEAIAEARGFRNMILSARDTAVAFYLALGYEIYDEPLTEVGIPHRRMRKSLGGLLDG